MMTRVDRKVQTTMQLMREGVTDGLESALQQAKEAAKGKDVRIGGGVSVIRQYLFAGLIDEMHLAVSPVLPGEGEHLFSGINLPQLGFAPLRTVLEKMQPAFLLTRDNAIMSAKKFAHPTVLPEGFVYEPDFLSESEEGELLRTVETLQFGAYDFRGYIAKRRVVAYGQGYDSGTRRTAITDQVIPDFLSPIRDRAAVIAGVPADEIVQALVTEYSLGTPIGWHRDAPQFESIIGISLRSSCRLRLKPYQGDGEIISVTLEPRSIYVMRGPVRWRFQHSIPAVKDLRYSITLRTLSKKQTSRAS